MRGLRSVAVLFGVLSVSLGLVACGGGGGGGNGSKSNSQYGVRVFHAAIDAPPVDLISSAASSPLVSQVVFADDSGYSSLPSGAQALSVTKTKTPSVVFDSTPVTYTSPEKYSVLLYGDLVTFGLNTRLLRDDVPASIPGAAVRIVNGVTKAADLSLSVAGNSVQSVPFSQNTDYLQTSAGQVTISATRSVDGALVYSSSVTLQAGRAYTLLLAGEAGYYVKGVLFADS